MSKFVIDVFLNSIVWVEETELITNKYRYKIVSEKKLRDIMNKNYIKINKIIKKNNTNGYYHLSMKPLSTLIDTSEKGTTYIGNTNLYYHPVGLYFSCGIKYFEKKKSLHYSYIYELKFNKSVLKITSFKSFVDFINKYKYPQSKIKIHNILDWKQIKKDYDGIIICPYLHKQIFGNTKQLLDIYQDENIIQKNILKEHGKNWYEKLILLSEWFRNWKPEGVVWRPTGIKEIRLIDKINIL
jgi:hypothetical protein